MKLINFWNRLISWKRQEAGIKYNNLKKVLVAEVRAAWHLMALW